MFRKTLALGLVMAVAYANNAAAEVQKDKVNELPTAVDQKPETKAPAAVDGEK